MNNDIFSQLILNWFHNNGRKNLPWQKNKTLYTIWISEIMLQQTMVKTVIPYFKKFIFNFPNLKSLQSGTLDEILYLWSGLGYYNRARNIYKTASIIKKQNKNQFPDQFSEIIKLPGIGKSTAGAILSLSLNYFFPILDGNIKRVLIRFYGIIGYLKDKKIEKKLWGIIELITPLHNTGKFNQAMMDIGSLICTPINPKCNICPLNNRCIAQKKQNWKNYPLKNIQKIKIIKKSWFVIIRINNTFWMNKNINTDIWKNLFCFPNFDTEKIALEWIKNKKININSYKTMPSFLHKFSHFTLHVYPILITLSLHKEISKINNTGIWYNIKHPQHIGLPKVVDTILKNF